MPQDLPTLTDCLAEPIAKRALLACLMIGFANGFVSAFVVLRKSALKIGTISHSLLPGLAVAVPHVLVAQAIQQFRGLGGAEDRASGGARVCRRLSRRGLYGEHALLLPRRSRRAVRRLRKYSADGCEPVDAEADPGGL